MIHSYYDLILLGMKRTLLLLFIFNCLLGYADTYPKNPNIDIRHYRFELKLFDDKDIIEGKTTIRVLFKTTEIKEIRLDLISKSEALAGKGMEIKHIATNGKVLDYLHEKDVLIIKLEASPKAGTEVEIALEYSGIPASGLKIGPNKHGDRTFFSDNWPNRARNWLPTVDHPYDKATSEMIIIAPNRYQVISNGLLMEETNLTNNLKRTHWKQSIPIASWLYVLGVAEFAVQYLEPFEGKSIQTWVYKQDREAGFYDFAVPTKHTLEFFSDYVGPFAYEKLANIQSNSVGGGMEAASAIFYGDNSVNGERTTRWQHVIIHEVAHQWFGNAVTEYDWDDVWLSEGFATYFTLLFREHAYGREDFVSGLKSSRDRVFNFYKDNKDYRIVHDNLDDMSKVTTGQTYQKGAWILHMLRDLLGDEVFKAGIQDYYARYMNLNATTSDFRNEMEMSSGKDLESFFSQWLYNGGHIVIEGDWSYDEIKKEIKININQLQNDGSQFSFPIEFGIYNEGNDLPQIVRVEVKEQKGTFSIPAQVMPQEVILDPRTVLLAEWKFEKSN
jgi:aminopeptidase N